MFDGLSVANIELSSRCNKVPGCFCCGRRKMEKQYPELCDWGDMDTELACNISYMLPKNIVVQFHSNGESLLHPDFGYITSYYVNQIKCIDTNGKLIVEKAKELIDNLDTLTISVIENDPEGDKQYEIVKKFLKIKKDRKPLMIYRLLGKVDKEKRWYDLPGIVATRALHHPMGSYQYEKKTTIPEIGCCLEILSHLVINRKGLVSMCVRFDPHGELVIGDLSKESLSDIWNGEKRRNYIKEHLKGNRKCNSICAKCEFWGIPISN